MEFLADEARQITELPKCGASKLASETSKFGWKIWFLEVILIICISIYTRMYVIIYYVYVCISYDYVCIYIYDISNTLTYILIQSMRLLYFQ